MANNSDNIQMVRPKTDGVAYLAANGTSLPTGATAALTSFESIGYMNEDGISLSINRTKQSIKDMGGSDVVTIQTEHTVKITIKPLEWNDHVKKIMFGDSNVDASGNVKINADEIGEKPWVFDMQGRNKKLIRLCVPRMDLETHDALNFKAADVLASGITFNCLPDAQGNKAYIYEATAE